MRRIADLQIAVVFLQRKNRKGWFAVTEALVPWEEHLISVTFVTRATTTRNTLNAALLQTLTFCSERRANVPALVGSPVSIHLQKRDSARLDCYEKWECETLLHLDREHSAVPSQHT